MTDLYKDIRDGLDSLESKLSATEFRKRYPELYKVLSKEANDRGFKRVRELLKYFDRYNTLETKRNCVTCGKEIDSVSTNYCCSRSCYVKMNHEKGGMTERIRKSLLEHNREISAEERSERARKSYRSRIENGNAENWIPKANETKKERLEERKRSLRIKTRERVERVIEKGKLRLFLRIKFLLKNTGTTWLGPFKRELSMFKDILPEDFDYEYERVISVKGLHNLKRCPTCDKPIITNSEHCSYECLRSNPVYIELSRKNTTEMWKRPEYRRLMEEKLRERWECLSDEEKRRWSEKMLNSMGEEGRIERKEKALQTKLQRKIISGIYYAEKDPDRLRYDREVSVLTKKSRNDIIQESGISFGKKTYHLDHIFPVSKGYIYGIPPELIGDRRNLQVLPAQENRKKNAKITEIPEHIQAYIEENGIDIED